MKTITKIVVTGGPCAGKTTFMGHVTEKLQTLGYGVLVVAESATELINAGCVPHHTISLHAFQAALLDTQLAREEVYEQIASRLECTHVVMLFDRGMMDNRAYIDHDIWMSLLEEIDHSHISLRDMRYDAVIHLQTAAIGAEAFYTHENNRARSETLEVARLLDTKTLEAWIGHSHVHIVGNESSGSFDNKIKRAFDVVLKTVGVPVPLEIERRFLIAPQFTVSQIPSYIHCVELEQVYITDGCRLRKRTEGKDSMYIQTTKRTVSPSIHEEEEHPVTEERYLTGLSRIYPNTRILHKKRITFVYDEQYFELDVFDQSITLSGEPLIILEIELVEENTEVRLPPWLPVIREITGDQKLSNRSLANIP